MNFICNAFIYFSHPSFYVPHPPTHPNSLVFNTGENEDSIMAKASKGNTGRDWWPNQVHLFELHCATWFLPSCTVCPLHRDPSILSFVRIWGADSSQPCECQKTLHLLIGFLRPPQQIILFLRCLKMTSISHVLWTSVSVAFHVFYTHDFSAHKPELTGRSLQLSNKWLTQSVRRRA